MRLMRQVITVLGLCAMPVASPAAVPGVRLGYYRVVLQLPGGELPFGLELTRKGDATVGYLLNGKERVKLTDVTITGAHLDINMPGYENRLIADAQQPAPEGDRDTLRGEIILDKLGGKQQHVPLAATRGDRYRFFKAGTGTGTNADVSGRWTVNFVDADGSNEVAVGEFTQSQDTVTGTFLTETGDHRFLAGQVKGDQLYLSTFDGAHAFLYQATLGADGSLSGDFWSGMAGHEKWTARRDAHAALRDAYSLTAMRGGARQFEFAFPDLAGRMVTSKDPKFQGKVRIILVAGSWCPNCHDEAAFMAPLYRQYRGRGLEIISLMFEHYGDLPHAAAATQRFKEHYGIDYTTLIAGISDKDEASKTLPMLDRVYGFPTTIFIDKKGVVRKVHTGFSGPATGEHYTEFVKEVKSTLDELLAET
jgi:thiol-disulfide isomerase/thioredoxin